MTPSSPLTAFAELVLTNDKERLEFKDIRPLTSSPVVTVYSYQNLRVEIKPDPWIVRLRLTAESGIDKVSGFLSPSNVGFMF